MTTMKSRRSRSRPDLDVGFRLLEGANGQHYYLGVSEYEIPQPPRAPEPFKIAAASSTMSRAHRRSSFVIIAEAEQPTTKLPIDSPVHGIRGRSQSPSSPSRENRGRASPFRPRGFKGPPPHAQSRPPSPPPPRPANRRRFVKPKSLSQGNSPRKQSLIPQPRGGQITMRNDSDKRVQGRWERRGSRKLNHTRIPRSSSLKTPQPAPRPSIDVTTRTTKKPIVVKKPMLKQAMKSPTKIPIRNPVNGQNKRFIQVPDEGKSKKVTKKMEEKINEMKEKKNEHINPTQQSMELANNLSPLVTNESVIMKVDTSPTDEKTKPDTTDGDFGLVDLLKQSSGASGTSSVVNAATTTAVQPLRIDAATILPQEILETKKAKSNPSNETAKFVVKKSENHTSQKINNNFAGQTVATVVAVEASQDIEAIIEVRPKDEVKEDKDEPPKTKEVVSVSTDEPGRINVSEPRSNVSNPVLHHDLSRTSPNSNESTSIVRDKLQYHESEASLKSSKSNEMSTGSVESLRSTDTGVSLNTVKGMRSVSSAKEEHGTHLVQRPDEIETLSGNVIHSENRENAEPIVVEAAEPATPQIRQEAHGQPMTRLGRFHQWRNSISSRYRDRFRDMKCLNCRRKNVQHQPEVQRPTTGRQLPAVQSVCSRLRAAFCRSFRWSSKIAPSDSTSCCRKEGCCTNFLCKKRNFCRWPGCCLSCCRCSCCGHGGERSDQRSRSIRAKHSLTSIAPPPISEEQKSKIPDVLIEHNSVMRGAIPCLPVSLAWFCLVWNILLPGSGTVWSGFFNLCVGQPRFGATTSAKGRIGAFIVNLIVGISQLFTVLFCLVGWGWSIWWGITMLRLARKWKRFKASEVANGDPEARVGDGGVLPAPGVPNHALRGIERAR